MRILFVLEHFHPYTGGAEELFRYLTVELVKSGYEIEVVTTRFDPKLPEREIYKGVHIRRISSGNRYLFTFMSLPGVVRAARQVDLIHTTSYNSAIPAFIAAKLTGKKVFITFHEAWRNLWFKLPFISKPLQWAYYLYEQFILRLPFDKYIAVSEYTKDCLQANRVRKDKIEHIYNGMHYDRFEPYSHEPPAEYTFCFFGRLGISKGIDLVIEATAQLLETRSDFKLKCIIPTYPKPLYRKVMARMEDLGILDHITLLHDLPKDVLLREISNSSCALIPSYSEGFCFAATECVAMNVPILSSGQGALAETVTGKVITMDSLTAESLSKSMLRAMNDDWDDIPKRIFPLDESVEQYLELYGSS